MIDSGRCANHGGVQVTVRRHQLGMCRIWPKSHLKCQEEQLLCYGGVWDDLWFSLCVCVLWACTHFPQSIAFAVSPLSLWMLCWKPAVIKSVVSITLFKEGWFVVSHWREKQLFLIFCGYSLAEVNKFCSEKNPFRWMLVSDIVMGVKSWL